MTIHIPAWVNGTLAPVGKMEAHEKGLRHKAVSIFLLRDDCVLLQRRALSKYHTPGLWANTCCTHPHWGENALECAHRRLREELEITHASLEYCDTVEYRADVGKGLIEHEVVDIFVGELPEPQAPRPNPAEVMDTVWHPMATLAHDVLTRPEIFTPWLRIYLRDHAEKIFGLTLDG